MSTIRYKNKTWAIVDPESAKEMRRGGIPPIDQRMIDAFGYEKALKNWLYMCKVVCEHSSTQRKLDAKLGEKHSWTPQQKGQFSQEIPVGYGKIVNASLEIDETPEEKSKIESPVLPEASEKKSLEKEVKEQVEKLKEKGAKELAANEEKEAESKADKKKDTIQDIAKEKKSWQEAGPEEALAFLKEKQDEYTPEAWSTLIKELKIPLMIIAAFKAQKDNPGLHSQAIEVIAAAKAEFKETTEIINTTPLEKSRFMRAYWTIARLLPHVYTQKNVEEVEKMALNLIKKHKNVESLDNLFGVFLDVTEGVVVWPRGIIYNADLGYFLRERKKLVCYYILWGNGGGENNFPQEGVMDLLRRAKWVSTPDFTGVILIDSEARTELRSRNGNIIRFTFQELKTKLNEPTANNNWQAYSDSHNSLTEEQLELRRAVESLPFVFGMKARLARLRKNEADAYYYEKAAQIHEEWQRGPRYERNPGAENDKIDEGHLFPVDWNMLVRHKRFAEGVQALLNNPFGNKTAIPTLNLVTLLGNLINYGPYKRGKDGRVTREREVILTKDDNGNVIKDNEGNEVPKNANYLEFAQRHPGQEIPLQFHERGLAGREEGYFQREVFGGAASAIYMDAVTALLGSFNIRIIPSKANLVYNEKDNTYLLTIEEVILDVKDDFDFNDDDDDTQKLGAVNPDTLQIKRTESEGYIPLSNEKFREYRTLTGKGHDRRVFATSGSMKINKKKFLFYPKDPSAKQNLTTSNMGYKLTR